MTAAWTREESLAAGKACLEAALAYLRLGWSVLCLCPPDHVGVGRAHGKTCRDPKHWGKRPWGNDGRWKKFQQERATEQQARDWWRQINGNVGVALGPVSGVVRIDAEGEAAGVKLAEVSGGDLPPTPEFTSGKPGGRGLLYGVPEGVEARTGVEGLADGELRIQGLGAQTVLPPSRHHSGRVYAWVPGRSPWEVAVAPAPPWLLEKLKRGGTKAPDTNVAEGELIPEGRRDSTLTSMAGVMRRRGFGEAAILNALAAENLERCDPPLEEGQVSKIARSVARYEPDAYADVTIVRPAVVEATPADFDGLDLTCLSGVLPQPLYWLVPGLLPLGKLVLVAGDGGHGKSTLTLALAASLSRGQSAFGLAYAPDAPCEVLLASCEDDYADTVVPRLLCHGADMARIYRIDGLRTKDKGKSAPFTLACYEAIERELERRPDVRLVVVDPAGAFIGRTGVDDYKDSELRALLGPLSDLAARRRVTILLVKHLVKGVTTKAVHKVSGGAGYVNAVRAAYVVTPDKDDDGLKLFLPLKFNLGPHPEGFSYRLVELPEPERTPILRSMTHLTYEDKERLAKQLFRVQWEGAVTVKADDALAGTAQGRRGKKEEAAEWLRTFLGQYAYPCDEIIKAADAAGFKERVLWFARKDLCPYVKSYRVSGAWWWGLGPRDDWTFRPEPVVGQDGGGAEERPPD